MGLVLLPCVLLMACGKPAAPDGAPAAAASADDAPHVQHGDYTALFALKESDCPLLTTDEVAQALSLPGGNVTGVDTAPCSYVITMPDGSRSPLRITTGARNQAQFNNEIDSYLNDETGLLSATRDTGGDNYLCLHKPRGWLHIYNPDYDHYVLLSFSTILFAATHKGVTVTPAKTIRSNAIKVANRLIQKYRN